jgi:hypothetical protein
VRLDPQPGCAHDLHPAQVARRLPYTFLPYFSGFFCFPSRMARSTYGAMLCLCSVMLAQLPQCNGTSADSDVTIHQIEQSLQSTVHQPSRTTVLSLCCCRRRGACGLRVALLNIVRQSRFQVLQCRCTPPRAFSELTIPPILSCTRSRCPAGSPPSSLSRRTTSCSALVTACAVHHRYQSGHSQRCNCSSSWYQAPLL